MTHGSIKILYRGSKKFVFMHTCHDGGNAFELAIKLPFLLAEYERWHPKAWRMKQFRYFLKKKTHKMYELDSSYIGGWITCLSGMQFWVPISKDAYGTEDLRYWDYPDDHEVEIIIENDDELTIRFSDLFSKEIMEEIDEEGEIEAIKIVERLNKKLPDDIKITRNGKKLEWRYNFTKIIAHLFSVQLAKQAKKK